MEKVVCGGVSVDIPSEICEDVGLLFDIISPDTWNNHLTDDHREMLMGFLPEFPQDDLEEKKRTLEMFFMDENFRHGTPLRVFHNQLCKGHFNPKIAKMRTIHKKILYREYRYRQKQYFHHTLEETLVRRKRVLDIVTNMPPDDIPKIPRLPPLHNKRKSSRTTIEYCTKKRYFRDLATIRGEADDNSELSEDEIYPEGPGASLNKKQRRQLGGLEGSLPGDLLPVRATHSSGSLALDLELKITPTSNPLDLTDDHFRAMLAQHRIRRSKRETSVDLDTRGITLQDIITRAQTQMKRPPLRATAVSPLTLDHKPNKKKVKVKKEQLTGPVHTPALVSSVSAVDLLPATKVKVEVASETESESSSSESSSVSDGEDVEVKKEMPPTPVPVKPSRVSASGNNSSSIGGGGSSGSIGVKNTTRIKTEPVDPPPPLPPPHPPMPPDDSLEGCVMMGGMMGEVVKMGDDKVKVEVKEEPMEDQVTAAIETSSELTAALESIGACIAPELTQETHICFFSLVRDIICSTSEQRMTRAQLESSIRVWQESAISPLNEWYGLTPSWVAILPSAINFLCGHFADVQPADFVPYIEYKSGLRVYQWIGAGRDSDGHLEPLAQFWLNNKSSMSGDWIEEDGGSLGGKGGDGDDSDIIPPPRCYTSWMVQPATDQEKEAYRAQEKLRYEKPHKAFTFMTHGYESVVGPVKGIYTQQTGLNKARGHSLLVPDRPAYVTILSLVRDAVARLPNGEGTRSDICELLKESQYLAPLPNTAAENNLNSVVSGALDRLHYENDPCVKYDTPRKLWIYLHRNRSEEEFERMHHLNGPGGSKVKKPAPRRQSRAKTKEPLAVKVAPGTPLDTLPSPTKASPLSGHVQTEGGQVRLKAEEVAVSAVAKVKAPESPVKLDHLAPAAVGKALTSVSGVRGAVGASSVQTIQVSTAGGVQTIKVALPPGAQTLSKVTPQQLAKVPASPIAKQVGGQAVSRGGAGAGVAKGVGTGTVKGTHLQQTVLQSAVGGASLTPESVLTTQHITSLAQGAAGVGGKTRSPVVTLTTREAARLPTAAPPSVSQPRTSTTTPTPTSGPVPSPTTHHHHHHHPQHATLPAQVSSSGVGVGKLSNTATVVNMSSGPPQKSSVFSLGGIKLLQAAPQQLTGKGRSNSPTVVNSIAKLQTLMVDGKVLMQGGKAVAAGNVTMAGGVAGKQVITGVFPGQQIATVESLLSQGDKSATQQLQGGVTTTLAGNKLAGGNVIQVAGGGGGVQRLTLVSPGASHVPLSAASQRLILATASQAGKLDAAGNKTQVVQTIQTLQPAAVVQSSHAAATTTATATTATAQGTTNTTTTTAQARFFSVGQHQKTIVQGLNVAGKPSVLSASGLRLVQPGVGSAGAPGGGTTAAVVASGSAATGNLITIGGKQVLLTSKPFSQQGQLQQVMLTSGNLKGALQGAPGGAAGGGGGSQGAVVVASGAGGQIVLPASALQGSQLNLKGLQAFHTLKVIPASQVTQQQRGKPVLARIVSPAAVRGAIPTTSVASIPSQQHDGGGGNTKS